MKITQQSRAVFLVGLVAIGMLAACGEVTPTEEGTPVPGSPYPTEDHFRRGNELSQAGDFEQAIDEYLKVLELEPEDVDAMTNLGVAYYNVGKLDEAIKEYRRAIELAPGDADIRSNLAAAYVQKYQLTGALDQLNRALAEYQRAVELAPDLPEARFGLGVVYLLLGRNDDALQAFEAFEHLDTGEDPIATNNAKEYLKQLRTATPVP